MIDLADLDRFHARRDASVRGPQGPLALVRTAWIAEPVSFDDIPGTWAPTASGEGVALTATADDDITVDGVLVDGTVAVPITSPARGHIRFDAHRTGTVVDRPSGPALRIWDAASPAATRFTGIASFDADPAWVLRGTFEAVDGGVAFTHGRSQGGDDDAVSPGVVRVEIGGAQYGLLALPGGDRLQIVFRDATSGVSTYGACRFLYARPEPDGSVELDFNRAIVPPCSMSDQFNCPLPPASNRIAVAIEAGERLPTFAEV